MARALVGFLGLAALTGCNEIFGIVDLPPKSSTSASTTTGAGGPGGGGGSNEFWAHNFGDTTPEESYRVAVDSQGGVLVAAAFGGFLSFDRLLEASGEEDGCALKLSPSGDPEWSYQVGGTGMQQLGVVAFDADDVPYVAGNFVGETQFSDSESVLALAPEFYVARIGKSGESGPPFTWSSGWLWYMLLHESGFSVFGEFNDSLTFPGVATLTSDLGADGFAAQIDANGSAAWASRIEGAEVDVQIRRAARDASMTVLSAHAVAGGGAFLAFADNADGGIIHTSWGNVHGFAEVHDLVITPSATIVVVGSFTGTMRFDTSELASSDEDIFFLAFRVTPTLQVNVLALKRYGGMGRDVPRALTLTPRGVAITGVMSSAVDFGGDPLPHVDSEDVFVVELTEAGDFVRGVALGGPARQEGRDLALASDGHMIVTGVMEETLTIEGKTLYSGGSTDIFVAKMPW